MVNARFLEGLKIAIETGDYQGGVCWAQWIADDLGIDNTICYRSHEWPVLLALGTVRNNFEKHCKY